ncbi:MAG: prolipoprotein diacylglyceryl transferase [Acutalibacteraceae bacterium]|jgi:phosphatidylglycerol:prolipoprotein diacylglycerol transferase|nr:prolipoprotein diacylglyceryl transferase [Acutalibacteraceae bacterium]
MTYNVTIFGIHLKLNPIAFSIPLGSKHWDIYWYGIIIATGFLLALIYAIKNAKRFGIDTDRMLDIVLVVTPVAILSARTYYVIFDGEKLNGIGDFFGFGDSSGFSGIAIYGGVIGAFVSGFIMCKIRKVNFRDMFDLASLGFLIGQGVGRWGNFVNQEAYGSFTNSSFWGMQSERTIREMGEGLVHPCFLYESVWCIAGFFIINRLSHNRKFSGETFLMYCGWYGFGRGFIELLRTDSLMLGSIKVSCLLAFVLCITSVTAIILIRKKLKPEEGYVSQFSENAEEENV